jgi:hypothetical protein
MRRLPRGVKKDDPRIYHPARDEQDAAAKVEACERSKEKLNHLLRRAAYHNDMLTAQRALQSGADPNGQNLLRESPIVSVCDKGSVEMLRLLLNHGASLGPDKFGVPPLIHAVAKAREDLISEIVKAGADVNGRENRCLTTALHRAVDGPAAPRLVRLLLELGADPREVDGGGGDALSRARSMQEHLGGIKPAVFKLLEAALKQWKGKPLPKKPRRRRKTETQKMADKCVDTEPGEPNT